MSLAYWYFPEDGSHLILGAMNNHLDILALLTSLDLKLVPAVPTHKACNHVALILTQNRTMNDLSVTPLHLLDHFFKQFTLSPQFMLSEESGAKPRASLARISQFFFNSFTGSMFSLCSQATCHFLPQPKISQFFSVFFLVLCSPTPTQPLHHTLNLSE